MNAPVKVEHLFRSGIAKGIEYFTQLPSKNFEQIYISTNSELLLSNHVLIYTS